MIETTVGSWIALLLLGAVHGLNPGMGWLFAVALGLQEEDGRAVWRSLIPLATGHAAALAFTIGVAALLGLVVSPQALRWVVAGSLLGFGVLHLRRHIHPRGRMRVGMGALTLWSFLMATAHGAGLMALPFVPAASATAKAYASEAARDPAHSIPGHRSRASHLEHPHAHHVAGMSIAGGNPHSGTESATAVRYVALLATLIHTAGYLVAAGSMAALVYYRLGLGMLRRAWINLDVVWAGALIATALMIPLL